MSQNSCCVPGCAVVRTDGVPLHRFPNPETSGDKFISWILNIGGEVAEMDRQDIYDNRRVCHRHFEDIHKYPSGRLSKLAIPTMHIPDLQAQSLGEELVVSNSDTTRRSQLQKCGFETSGIEPVEPCTSIFASPSNTETTISKPAHASPDIEAMISKPHLASTSYATLSRTLVSLARTWSANNTVAGTSNPQPGPSGTGPAKRLRPDDTALPSMPQVTVPKRVRVHSAQGEQRTYARATKDIPARLAVAIRFPPPSRDLTRTEAEHIKTVLENLMMDTDSTTPLPAFRGFPRVAEGTVQLWCEDDTALTWLTQNVPKITLPDVDLALSVVKQSDVPTRVRASLFVPRYKGDIARLQSILIRQNTWYDIARWSLYRATTVGGDNHGTYLTLGVPPEEAERVLSRACRISYLLRSIYVRFGPRALPSDPQPDDETPTPTVPTNATTNDTDMVKLEEVMARAAMADEEDAILPPASPGWNEHLLVSSSDDQHVDLYREEEAERSYD